MNEKEWLACNDPWPMLDCALDKGRRGAMAMPQAARRAMQHRSGRGRKFRLYACAWCRRFSNMTADRRLLEALEVTEKYADGLESDSAFRAAKRRARAALAQARASEGPDGPGTCFASCVSDVMSLRFLPGWDPHREEQSGTRSEEAESRHQALKRYQSGLLHDLFGPLLFRPVTISPLWQTVTVLALAQAAYDNRTLPAGTLEPERLAVLADALEESGCTDAEILGHLRGDGPHWRGCWAVDAILGRS